MKPNEHNGPLKNQIRRMRFEHGEMTQQDLADRVGVTRQTIIALEAGNRALAAPGLPAGPGLRRGSRSTFPA